MEPEEIVSTPPAAPPWKKLFEERGWIVRNQVVLPEGLEVSLDFSDSNTGFKVRLEHVVEVTEDFLILEPTDTQQILYPWSGIVRVSILAKAGSGGFHRRSGGLADRLRQR